MLIPRALELPSGKEVIVPSFTFAATAQALVWKRLTPVFCECLFI
jgi:dTDP-4-amino-4,6-dideoxygalactose transaminase